MTFTKNEQQILSAALFTEILNGTPGWLGRIATEPMFAVSECKRMLATHRVSLQKGIGQSTLKTSSLELQLNELDTLSAKL